MYNICIYNVCSFCKYQLLKNIFSQFAVWIISVSNSASQTTYLLSGCYDAKEYTSLIKFFLHFYQSVLCSKDPIGWSLKENQYT